MDDVIRLRGMQFYAYHGVDPEERALGQRFEVDLELRLDLAPAGRADDLSKTVNYREVYGIVAAQMEHPCRLIETVAENIAAAVLERFEGTSLTVRVRKPSVPIGGVIAAAEVEIRRSRPSRP